MDVARSSVSEVLVLPAWRRRGVASALYPLIEWELGRALAPSRIRGRPIRQICESGQPFGADRDQDAVSRGSGRSRTGRGVPAGSVDTPHQPAESLIGPRRPISAGNLS